MVFRKEHSPDQPNDEPVCINLRNKAMFVTGSRNANCPHGGDAAQHCWCVLTQHTLGPDHSLVGREKCTSEARLLSPVTVAFTMRQGGRTRPPCISLAIRSARVDRKYRHGPHSVHRVRRRMDVVVPGPFTALPADRRS